MDTLLAQAPCKSEGGAISKIRRWSDRSSGWALIALGFSLPLSTSATSILLGLIILLWISGGNYRHKFESMRHHPVALASLILFALYLLGLLYGKPSARVVFDVTHFLLLALFIPLIGKARIREQALWAFSAAMLILMGLSYLSWMNLLPHVSFLNVNPPNVVIQDRITYGFFLAFAAFFWFVEAFRTESKSRQAALFFLIALALFSLLGVVNTMTAYLVLPTLFGYVLLSRWGWKGGVAVALGAALLATVTWSLAESPLRMRIAGAVKEFQQWRPDRAEDTSTGLRLEFYHHSLKIIREHPLFGVGVGGFAEAYAKQIKDPDMARSDNPHNEYLLVTAQLGVVGLAALFYLFYTLWRLAPRLAISRDGTLARGVVLAFLVGCLFNSFLTDFDEGVFFIWINAVLYSGLSPSKAA